MIHTTRCPAVIAAARSASVGTSLIAGSVSYPVTVCPAASIRARMLPPMRPRPTMPMCMSSSRAAVTVLAAGRPGERWLPGEPDRHEEVAEVVRALPLEALLPGEHGGLARVGEGHADEVGGQRAQAVEQVARVERGDDVLSDERRLEDL